jgi:glutamyl-tRNA reductase/protoheme ferro-lyase
MNAMSANVPHPSPHHAPARAAGRERHPTRVALLVRVATPAGGAGSTDGALARHAAALAATLPAGWRVLTATQRSRPTIADVLRAATEAGATELVMVPLSPHFAAAATGAATCELYRLLAELRAPINVAVRASWYDDAGYVNALASLIAKHVAAHDVRVGSTHLLFWTDAATPATLGLADDVWRRQVARTVELVTKRLGWPAQQVTLVCESAPVASAPGPATAARLAELERDAAPHVLLCPLTPGFTADALAPNPRGAAYRTFQLDVCPRLDAHELFVPVLRDLVLRGCRPLAAPDAPPLLAPAAPTPEPADERAFLMIGASLANGMGAGHGPQIRHSAPAAFAAVRKSRKALHAFLQWIRQQELASEAFVWDTCQRIEFYGWLTEADDVAARECAASRIRHQLYGAEPRGLEVNVLVGDAARHHLLRTACGLNSALPGDTDVVAQLQTALRIAGCGGVAGDRATELVQQASALAEGVRAETSWGGIATGYCLAALSHLHARGAVFPERRHVVIGGSTTSRSILAALTDRFHVSPSQLTLIYRDHHGQMKLLRSAIGHGRRLRVHDYAEPGVLQAVGEADFVFFGIDQNDPVLDPSALHGLRDFLAHPLTIVDFNSFGSLGGAAPPPGVTIWTAADLERAVAEHAAALQAQREFGKAVEEAEQWIESRLAPVGALT